MLEARSDGLLSQQEREHHRLNFRIAQAVVPSVLESHVLEDRLRLALLDRCKNLVHSLPDFRLGARLGRCAPQREGGDEPPWDRFAWPFLQVRTPETAS